MLPTLSAPKSRLAIDSLNVQYDDLLTIARTALSVRFNRETSRTLALTANITCDFDPSDTEILRSRFFFVTSFICFQTPLLT